MLTRFTFAAALALALSAGGALAQTAAPAAAPAMAPAAGAPMTKGAKPRTAQSIECSRKADAQNIHGKPRSAFMRKCKVGKA